MHVLTGLSVFVEDQGKQGRKEEGVGIAAREHRNPGSFISGADEDHHNSNPCAKMVSVGFIGREEFGIARWRQFQGVHAFTRRQLCTRPASTFALTFGCRVGFSGSVRGLCSARDEI